MDPPRDARCHRNFGSSSVWIDVSMQYVIPLISSVGVVGDLLMLLTMRCGKLHESPYVYLRCIALSNLILLLCQLSQAAVFCEACQFSLDMVYYLKFYYWYIHSILVNLMKTWLILLTILMTIERFVYVRWPMRTRSLCTRDRAKKICIILFLVSCCAEPLIPFQIRLEVTDQTYPKSGTTIRTSDFICVPQNEGNSSSEFTCYNRFFPVELPNNSSDPGRSNETEVLESGLRRISTSSKALYSLETLHNFCKLPLITKELKYTYHPIDESWGVLRSPFKKGLILAVMNKSTIETVGNFLPREELIGRALLVNDTCRFIIAPKDLREIFLGVRSHYMKKHQVTMKCVSAVPRTGWPKRFVEVYLSAWRYVHVLSTGLLTVFNVLIVVTVRRANRETSNKVFSDDNNQSAAMKRKSDEHRLTLTLLALSSVSVSTDILFITTWPAVARLFYEQVVPPGGPLIIHRIISVLAYSVEYSAQFYLVAFINRKFRREFLHQVVYGFFRMHKIVAGVRSIFSTPSRSTSLATSQDADTQKSASGARTDPLHRPHDWDYQRSIEQSEQKINDQP